MSDAILVLTTCASAEEAERISAALLQQRLVACASIGAPVTSRYRWQGKLETEAEVPLTLKTRRDCFERLAAEIQKLHSYEVPEIVAVPAVAISESYREWLEANTSCSPMA
ncbi:MAG: divalent-cation tolerance protein CutA [Terriglobales bacterium]